MSAERQKVRKTMEQNRFKSVVVWGAVVAQVLSILVAVGVFDEALSATIKTAIVGILQVLVAFGVLNNPTDGAAF